MPTRHWLLKTEPDTYAFERLLDDGKTNWNDVRNYQARNYLREVRKGDLALIYHSGAEKAVVGVARCSREGYPDVDSDDGSEWVQIDLEPVKPLPRPVPLATIKSVPELREIPLIRHTRLSVMPITKDHYESILALSRPSGKKSARR